MKSSLRLFGLLSVVSSSVAGYFISTETGGTAGQGEDIIERVVCSSDVIK